MASNASISAGPHTKRHSNCVVAHAQRPCYPGRLARRGARYPTRPITFIVAFAPGGFADSVARLLGSKLSERLGQSIIIENRAGGGGNIGAAAISKAAPDGYTLLVTTTGLAINETLSKSKGFAIDDLAVVAIPAWAPETLSVNPSSPAKNLARLLQIAKTKPINYASPGVGTSGHIANAYLFQELAKVEAVNVPFQGGALAVNALLGGHVDALAGAVTGYAGQLKAGIHLRHCRRGGTAPAAASRHSHLHGERLSDRCIDLGRPLRPGTNRHGDPAEAEHGGKRGAAGRLDAESIAGPADGVSDRRSRRRRRLFPPRCCAVEEDDHAHRAGAAIRQERQLRRPLLHYVALSGTSHRPYHPCAQSCR